MIIEVRVYKTKPGLRSRFLQFFEEKAGPLQQRIGIQVFGPFIDLDDADSFVWLRAFPDMPERDRMKNALYEGPEWKGGLEAEAMPILEDYKSITTETTAHTFTFRDLQSRQGEIASRTGLIQKGN
jgi:hypothetical protein